MCLHHGPLVLKSLSKKDRKEFVGNFSEPRVKTNLLKTNFNLKVKTLIFFLIWC